MKKMMCLGLLMVVYLLVGALAYSQDQPLWRVDDYGTITKDGNPFRIRGGSWFGLEGRFEPLYDSLNPGGAPMEIYMGNVFWQPSRRTYDQDISDFKALGFNVIRLPLSPQTLDPSDPQGREPFLKNAPEVIIENARLALETIIKKLDDAGIYVVLDLHSCSNYLGTKAGRLDARPPYYPTDLDNWGLSRDECSCAATNNPSDVTHIQAYNEAKWLSDLKTLAGLADELGVNNIMGIDIFNEPWDYTWEEWRDMIDRAFYAINEVNPNILIFAQGVGFMAGIQDGTPETTVEVPHGNEFSHPLWGENLYEAGDNPPSMPRNRLVYAPHCYGPSVYLQSMFLDPDQLECQGLEGEEAAKKKCNIVINQDVLEEAWDEHFGYLKKLGYGLVIGEFGGNPDWPNNAPISEQSLYSYLPVQTFDLQWQKTFINYLLKRGITDSIYWALNPESETTGGVFQHAYDPVSNTGGWGTWLSPSQVRMNLLEDLWGSIPLTPTPTPTLTPSPKPTVVGQLQGDVNGDMSVNIIDSLQIAQFYIGMDLQIITEAGDVNCDNNVDIVDALIVAQYYVGQLKEFCLLD